MTEELKKIVWKSRICGYADVDPAQLLAHPHNHRIHPKKQQDALTGSLDTLGYIQPIIVSKKTDTVIDGHLRVVMALREGQTSIPVTYVELSEAEEAQALLSLDPIAAMAANDRDKIEELLHMVQTDNAEVMKHLADFATENKLDYGQPEQVDAEPQIDRAAELQEKWQTTSGQLWKLGEHRLLIGSSLERDNWVRLCGDERATLTWTDPPYGVNYGEKLDSTNPIAHRVRTIENDDLPPDQLEEFVRTALKNCAEFSGKGAAIYVACPPGTLLPAIIKAMAGSGYDYRWHLVWVKDQIVLSRADYHFKHENILYGWKPDGAHYFIDDRKQSSVFEYPRPKKSEEHPTMKPVELVEHMIKNSSRVGDIVLEPFGGSGTTLLACQRQGRICRVTELSEKYGAVILERFLQATGIQPELVN